MIIRILLFLLFVPSLYFAQAAPVTFNSPTWNDLSSRGVSGSFPPNDFYALPNWQSTEGVDYGVKFCSDIGSSYVSHVNDLNYQNGSFVALNFNQTQYETSVYASDFAEIVCDFPSGCTNPNSSNFDPNAEIDDGSCNACNTTDFQGCSESGCNNITFFWDQSASECRPNQTGCTDPDAENYNPQATVGNQQQYCIYCSVSTPGNCSTQSDCELVGGNWNTISGECSAFGSGGGSGGVASEVTIKIPDDSPFTVSAPVPAGFDQFVSASCVELNSSGICSGFRYDLSQDFQNFLISLLWKVATYFLFICFLSLFFLKVWGYLSRIFFHSR